jgi:hypothetical protein
MNGTSSISSEVFTKALHGVRLASTRILPGKRGVLQRGLINCCLLLAAECFAAGVMRADTIQLAPAAQLTVDFAMPGFDPNNPGAVFPTTIGLELVGTVPFGSKTAPIPGSSQSYFTGILMQAALRSKDGAVSLPLFDADSWRLGLATGTLVADSTGLDADGNQTAIIFAQVAVSLNASQAIFGASGQAEFVIQNLGGLFTIGLGPGYSLSNAVLAPLTSNNGSYQSAGYLTSMQVTGATTANDIASVPEPAAFGLAAAGGALVFWLRKRAKP